MISEKKSSHVQELSNTFLSNPWVIVELFCAYFKTDRVNKWILWYFTIGEGRSQCGELRKNPMTYDLMLRYQYEPVIS